LGQYQLLVVLSSQLVQPEHIETLFQSGIRHCLRLPDMDVTHQSSVDVFRPLETKSHITILIKGFSYEKRHYQNQTQNQGHHNMY